MRKRIKNKITQSPLGGIVSIMSKSITVYTRSTCAPCFALKRFLSNKGLSYKEVNVDVNPSEMDTVIQLSGFQMVPCTVVEESGSQQVVAGYNLSSLSRALA